MLGARFHEHPHCTHALFLLLLTYVLIVSRFGSMHLTATIGVCDTRADVCSRYGRVSLRPVAPCRADNMEDLDFERRRELRRQKREEMRLEAER